MSGKRKSTQRADGETPWFSNHPRKLTKVQVARIKSIVTRETKSKFGFKPSFDFFHNEGDMSFVTVSRSTDCPRESTMNSFRKLVKQKLGASLCYMTMWHWDGGKVILELYHNKGLRYSQYK
jgi:hypothetical protein